MPTNPRNLLDMEDVPDDHKYALRDIFILWFLEWHWCWWVRRLLIWATKENLRRLARTHEWYVDGTFKVLPNIFFQLFDVLSAVLQPTNSVEKKLSFHLYTSRIRPLSKYQKPRKLVPMEIWRQVIQSGRKRKMMMAKLGSIFEISDTM